MKHHTRFIITLLCSTFVILGGCSGPGKSSGGGGYYKDDGPGSNIPRDIEAIPDAVPRVEKHARANFRPYVVFGKRYVPVSDEKPFRQEGTASWYGRKFHGKQTANGEIYDMYAMTAAHPTLPLPSYARVTRAVTGKSVIVRINDRGPFHSSRIIDLSYVAAAKLGLIGPGSGQVIVEAITNQDILASRHQQPKATPIAPAAPPMPQPVLTTRSQSVVPDALQALQHEVAFTQPDSRVTSATSAIYSSADGLQSAARPATAGVVAVRTEPQIYLQFGAFSIPGTADTLAQRLNDRIGLVETRMAQVSSGSDLHRVQIGPYPSRTAAVNAAVRIQEETGMQGSVTLR